jgi:hypothetical protein
MTRSLADQLLKYTQGELQMSLTNSAAIQAYAAATKPVLDSLIAALNAIATGVTNLDTLITTLQNSPGTITPDDQATLDAAQAEVVQLQTIVSNINTTPPGQAVPPPPAAPARKR